MFLLCKEQLLNKNKNASLTKEKKEMQYRNTIKKEHLYPLLPDSDLRFC